MLETQWYVDVKLLLLNVTPTGESLLVIARDDELFLEILVKVFATFRSVDWRKMG
jgi:hypothetical protein